MEKLCDLLGIRPGITALIGGGGKTTLMYHLARELRQCGTVAVTTTTRIWPPTGIAVAREPDAAREILDREGLVCLGVPSAQGKLVSPAFEGWDALADYTLVEAETLEKRWKLYREGGRPLKFLAYREALRYQKERDLYKDYTVELYAFREKEIRLAA